MSINIHILSESKHIGPYVDQLKSITESTIVLVKKLLPIKDIDIVIYENPIAVISEVGGIGGFTPNANTIFISLDPLNINFKKAISNELTFVLAHELHHTIRWQKPVATDMLLEALVFEGMAEKFAMEVTGRSKPSPWAQALTVEQKAVVLEKARKEWKLPSYDNALWFFGSNPDLIPRWAGYTIGYDLVRKYLEAHPLSSASTLVQEDAELFVT